MKFLTGETVYCGYTISEFEAMIQQDQYVILSEFDSAGGRMTMLCELDPNAWFDSQLLIEDMQSRLTAVPDMPYGTYRMRLRAGDTAFPSLKTALPPHMAGSVERRRKTRSNEFLVTMSRDSRMQYFPVDEELPATEWSADPFTAQYLREMRLRADAGAEPESDGARIRGRMRITRPAPVRCSPARRACVHVFLIALFVMLLGIALFLTEPGVRTLLAAGF